MSRTREATPVPSSIFFPLTRNAWLRPADLLEFVWQPWLAMVARLYAAKAVPRLEGLLVLEKFSDASEIVHYVLGWPDTWENPYAEIVDGKRKIGRRVGPLGSRAAQMAETGWIEPDDNVHHGTSCRENVLAIFSGFDATSDQRLSGCALELYLCEKDHRKTGLDVVTTALGLRYYWQAMEVVEQIAVANDLTDFDKVIAKIKQVMAVHWGRLAEHQMNVAGHDPQHDFNQLEMLAASLSSRRP